MIPSAASLLHPIEGTVRAFRLGMIAAGNDGLTVVLQGLQSAIQASFAPLPAAPFVPWVHALARARERGDHLCVADVLEFKIAPLLATVSPPQTAQRIEA